VILKRLSSQIHFNLFGAQDQYMDLFIWRLFCHGAGISSIKDRDNVKNDLLKRLSVLII
jgi:hypothetical protein